MPGWHEATKDLQDAGELQMVGIVQEQHPDRARLFMQWKEMGWPILVDSYNLLEVPYVPITLAIDEYGVIRQVQPPLDESERLEPTFLDQAYDRPAVSRENDRAVPNLADMTVPSSSASVHDWLSYANALAVWGGVDRLDQTINAYETVVRADPDNGTAHFRLGVAYRMRYDSPTRRDGDFQQAIEGWTAALDTDPNQYIWRRRIQQYGPRLDKPYPFYDWVHAARTAIESRGDTPVPLVVEPRGAEFAQPAETFEASNTSEDEPDPRGRVLRDDGQFISVETVAVPTSIEPGESARFHVVFRPVEENKAHWNNEAEDLAFWIDPPRGWDVEQRYLTLPIPPEPVSQETRSLEIEVRAPERHRARSVTIPAYALYYVCEDVNGVCMYRRQDIDLGIDVRRP